MKLTSKLLVLSAIALASTASLAEVVVTTGGGYIPMVKALVADYRAKTQNEVKTSFGGHIGAQLAQIKEGSKVNLVISDKVSLKKFTDVVSFDTVANLGETPLMLIWRKGLALTAPSDVTKDEVKSLAYPDPKAAIYGRAANDWLNETGLTPKVKDKVKIVSGVPQVVTYVSQGEMDAGFVNLFAARSAEDKLGGTLEVKNLKNPIFMVAVPVKGHENDKDIEDFLKYLKSDAATLVLAEFGVHR